MRNPFAYLARSDAPRPSLRDRAAALKASAARVIRCKPATEHNAEAAGRALAARVIEYFGSAPLDPDLDCDFRLRDMAQALLEGRTAITADPILAAISETVRLTWARNRADQVPLPTGDLGPSPEQNAACDAFFAHVNGVLLKTVPTTAAGCATLARYALDFRSDYGFNIDEDQSNEQHVRILDLIARSPLLGSATLAMPPAPDFSGYTVADLYRTYNALKMATDIMGLTGWATSSEGLGDRLLNAESDRLYHFQNYAADELARRDVTERSEVTFRADVLVSHSIACGDFDQVAVHAAEADAKRA